MVKPILLVSRCLGFEACRYNGQVLPDRFVDQLRSQVTIRTVCPEVEIGLGVPRDPIRLEAVKGEQRLLQPETGRDVTAAMQRFSREFLDGLGPVDGCILKSRSPSCGVRDAKVYAPRGKGAGGPRGPGLFARAVLERHPQAAVEDEGRLNDFKLREHFLTHLFTLARFRRVRKGGAMGPLVRFHAAHKLLLLACSEQRMRRLGRIVANPDRRPAAEVYAAYAAELGPAFHRQARYTSHINVLMHAFGYFSRQLTAREKAHFLDVLEDFRHGRVPVSAPISILQAWIVRFEEPYLGDQVYFAPYPEVLRSVSDSGKGRLR